MRVKSHCSTNLIRVKTNKAGDSGLLEASLLLVPVLKEVLVHLTSNSPFCLVLNLKNKQQMICGGDLQSSLGKLGPMSGSSFGPYIVFQLQSWFSVKRSVFQDT